MLVAKVKLSRSTYFAPCAKASCLHSIAATGSLLLHVQALGLRRTVRSGSLVHHTPNVQGLQAVTFSGSADMLLSAPHMIC
jgi:hypothetical protein